MTEQFTDLINAAIEARERAYAPYSKFTVGAALKCAQGEIIIGCNVENLSYGLTICAERNAVTSAVAQGVREFEAIAVVADSKDPISPCGACRQFLAEFSEEILVIMANLKGSVEHAPISDLLPRSRTGILDCD